MVDAKKHYASLLAAHYGWICGGTTAARKRFASLLTELALMPTRSGMRALDLGAGNGIQSFPLAEVGYTVTAVDFCDTLLKELREDAAAAHLPVDTQCADIRHIASLNEVQAHRYDLVLCMGDTLTHLETEAEVFRLLGDAAQLLAPGGALLLGFRDYSVPLQGNARFIPVRSEPDRLFTCFLEYETARVMVHDIVQTRGPDGWMTSISAYPKIRLAPNSIRTALESNGLHVAIERASAGSITILARN